jgi:RNA polymerase subunit RPABC4/transcription elongation factor Spt4
VSPILTAVICLILVLSGGTLFLLLRRPPRERGPSDEPPLSMRCPACRRAFPRGTRFCPDDAQRLITTRPLPREAMGEVPSGGRCPRCLRIYEAGTRFCPADAEALVPRGAASADAVGAHHHEAHEHHGLLAGDSKICPVCAAKYGLEASFCGRDGSELMTVN